MKVNLFTFAILLQLSLCIIAASESNKTEQAITEAVKATTVTPQAVDVTTVVTEKSAAAAAVTKTTDASVTTVQPVESTQATVKKVNKKKEKDAKKKSARARKMKAVSTPEPEEMEDDENAEDDEVRRPSIAHRSRGNKGRSSERSRRHHWPRGEATYRSRSNRRRNHQLASWRSEESERAKSSKREAGDDCSSTIECLKNYVDTKELCCKEAGEKGGPGNQPNENTKSLKPDPESKSGLTDPMNPGSGVDGKPQAGGATGPSPSTLPEKPPTGTQTSPVTGPVQPPLPPPPPPPQMCECSCPDDGSKVSITKAQFDSLRPVYRSGYGHDMFAWNPYAMGYMARNPYALAG